MLLFMHTVLKLSADMETSSCSHSLQIHGRNKKGMSRFEFQTYFKEFYKAIHLDSLVISTFIEYRLSLRRKTGFLQH